MDMEVVSYDSEEMEAVAQSYSSVLARVSKLREDMAHAVDQIQDRWKGDDALEAEKDLNAIKDQMKSIETNVETIVSLIKKVVGDFSQLNYKGGSNND